MRKFLCARTLSVSLTLGLTACMARSVVSQDASAPKLDAGAVSGTDTGAVSGTDAGAVSGTDAGMVLGTDARMGLDAGMDANGAGRDAGGPVDPNGWTLITPAVDSRVVYVSNTLGNDANNGLSVATPVKTIAHGASLVRTTFPDQLLLKKGDTWNEAFPAWNKSGRSTAAPLLIGAYGTGARPLLRTPLNANGFSSGGNTLIHDVALVGIHFQGRTAGYDEAEGMFWVVPTDGLLVEDCMLEAYHDNVVVEGSGSIQNIRIRRSVIVDSYDTVARSQGIFTDNVHGLLIEENVIDHNGWNPSVAGAVATIYNHNVYIQDTCSGLVFRGNISAEASSHGLQARSGGVVSDNLFVRDAISLVFGGGTDPVAGGVTGQVTNNVLLEGADIGTQARGMGIDVANIQSATISGNIIAHDISVMPFGHAFTALPPDTGSTPVSNLTLQNNVVYDWRGGLIFQDLAYSTIRITGNQLQDPRGVTTLISHEATTPPTAFTYSGNTYFSTRNAAQWFSRGAAAMSFAQFVTLTGETRATSARVTYPDPTRSVATYAGTLGQAATFAAFIQAARAQSRDTWNPAQTATSVNSYIRAGFAP